MASIAVLRYSTPSSIIRVSMTSVVVVVVIELVEIVVVEVCVLVLDVDVDERVVVDDRVTVVEVGGSLTTWRKPLEKRQAFSMQGLASFSIPTEMTMPRRCDISLERTLASGAAKGGSMGSAANRRVDTSTSCCAVAASCMRASGTGKVRKSRKLRCCSLCAKQLPIPRSGLRH